MTSETAAQAPTITFRELALAEPLLKTLTGLGYEAPTPIQAATIPLLLSGRRRPAPARPARSPCPC
jgi:ATP-dependent RNA helicase DeaD